MTDRFADDVAFAGRCYQELYMGLDTDEAEAAAVHQAKLNELLIQFLTRQ